MATENVRGILCNIDQSGETQDKHIFFFCDNYTIVAFFRLTWDLKNKDIEAYSMEYSHKIDWTKV